MSIEIIKENYIFVKSLTQEQLKDLRIRVTLILDEVSFGINTRRYKKKLIKEDRYKLIEKFKGDIDEICDYLQDKYKIRLL